MTVFGRHDARELPNSLTWGPTAGSMAGTGACSTRRKSSPKMRRRPYSFTCAIFRIHPVHAHVFKSGAGNGSNPWGIAIDPEGSFFASNCVIDHLWHLVESRGITIRQGGPYPPFTWPIESIVGHRAPEGRLLRHSHYFDDPACPAEFRGQALHG